MKKLVAVILAVVLLISLMPASFALVIGEGNYQFTILDREITTLAPGVEQQIVYSKMQRTGNQTVYYLAKANPRDENVEIHANYKDNDPSKWGMQKTTAQMAAAQARHSNPDDLENYVANYNVVAGINADFYNMNTGEPNGAFAMEGKIIKDAKGSFFAVLKDGTAVIGFSASEWTKYASDTENPIVEAVGGGDILIQNGVIREASNWKNENARTAIGITEDNEVVMLVMDGKQLPFSGGGDMADLAAVLKDAGCVSAINLDGGGSSTYAAKQEGEDYISLVNKPCDGYERIVSSSLMIVSTAPDNKEFDHAVLDNDTNYITPGGTVHISATGVTAAGTKAEIPQDAEWRVAEGSHGSVLNGVYTASESENDAGTAVVELVHGDKVVGTTEINVVIPDSFAFTADSYAIPYNESFDLEFVAMSEGLYEVTLHEGDFETTLDTPELGTLNGIHFTSRAADEGKTAAGTITARFKYGQLTDQTTITLGKGTEVLFDFESQDDVGQFEAIAPGSFEFLNIKEDIQLADRETGHVKSGDHSLAFHIDFTDTITYGNACQAMLRYIGEQEIDLTGALGIGAWIWVPDEEYAMSIWYRTWYNDTSGKRQRSDSDNYVVGNGMNYDEGHWVYLYQPLTDLQAQKISMANDALGILHVCIMSNGWDFTEQKSVNGDLWFYVDDITVDYSVVVPDRGLPQFGDVDAVLEDGQEVKMDHGVITDCQESASVSFTATVADDTSLRNVTGLDASSLEAFVDGVKVPASLQNGTVTVQPIRAAAGVHTLKIAVSDLAGNPASVTRQFQVNANTEVPTVSVEAHDPQLDRIPVGSVYYVDVKASDISAVDAVEMDLDLNNVSTWILNHADVDPKFELTSEVEDRENIAHVTLTRKTPYAPGDNNVLVSIPIRTWTSGAPLTITNSDKTQTVWTDEMFWTKDVLWGMDISVDVDRGVITFAEDYEGKKLNTFSGTGVQVDTELFGTAAQIKEAYPENKSWHVHSTELETVSQDATCTQNGYSNRQVCKVCHSPVSDDGWGEVLPAKGHSFAETDGVLKCSNCQMNFEGIYSDGKLYVDGRVIADGWTQEDLYYRDGKPLTGICEVDGLFYDFGETGVCEGQDGITGFFSYAGNVYYAISGERQIGWVSIGENNYHIGDDYVVHHVSEDGDALPAVRTDTRTCLQNGYIIYTCPDCEQELRSQLLWYEGHKWRNEEAGDYFCTVCGTTGIDIANCRVEFAGTYFTYTGSQILAMHTLYYTDPVTNEVRTLWTESDRDGRDGLSIFSDNIDIGYATLTVEGRGDFYGEVSAQFQIVPASVSTLNVTQGANHTLTLSWDSALGAQYYSVWHRENGVGDWVEIAPHVEGTSYTITDLSVGDRYAYRVASRAVADGEIFYCTNWSNTVASTIEHTWGEPEDGSHDATCTTDGLLRHTCKNCGYSEEIVLPALGHDWVADSEKSIAPACVQSGLDVRNCQRCGEHSETVIEALGHHWVEDTESSKPATCTEPGTKVMYCDRLEGCSERQVEEIPATGHNVETWTTTRYPTASQEGEESGVCTNCGETVTRPIDKLPSTPAGPSNPGSSGGGPSGPSSPGPSEQEPAPQEPGSETVENPDGSVTTTTTDEDGNVTEKTESTDGTVTEKVTQTDGTVRETVTEADGKVSETVRETDGTVTEKVQETDGTVRETVTGPDGASTATVTTPQGVVGQTVKNASGEVKSAEVTIPKAAENPGGAEPGDGAGTPAAPGAADAKKPVTVPVEVPAAADAASAPEVKITVEDDAKAEVEIPVTEFGPGTVAVVVREDGTEEVVRDCIMGENGVILGVEGSATIKIVDNTKTFTDVKETDWSKGATEFVAARQLFNGTGNGEFSPSVPMTRGMLATVMYHLAYEPEAAAADFTDLDSSAFYSEAVAWAEENGVMGGYPDHTFGGEDVMTREQLVMVMYNYANKLGLVADSENVLGDFNDTGDISGYAEEAMNWAVSVGMIHGVGGNSLAPKKDATRAEVATILMNFCTMVLH